MDILLYVGLILIFFALGGATKTLSDISATLKKIEAKMPDQASNQTLGPESH